MKKWLIFYYIGLILTIVIAMIECISMFSSPITSTPWYVGLLYPTCYFTILLLFISIFISKKYHHNHELMISSMILILQIFLLMY